MSVSAVPAAPPLAVLVLAWGEATPAVRALVEATQASAPVFDSILVLVPQADAPDHLSAEEFLPIPPLVPELLPVAAATTTEPDKPEPEPLLAPINEPALPVAASLASEAFYVHNIDIEQVAISMTPTNTVPLAPLAWAAVRVLRLGSFSLSQLAQLAGQPLPAPTWLGPATIPAAPYLGTSASTNQPHLPINTIESIFYPENLELPALVPEPSEAPALTAEPLPAAEAGLTKEEVALYDPIAQAPDPEADLPAIKAEEPASSEITDSQSSLAPPAPHTSVQASWPEALAALRQPAHLPEPPVAVPDTVAAASFPPAHPALRPAATHYPAPDLNFQVIQYARFAVPVALAEPPFAVVYAPAWPTWLAAQELRQRTGQPLVLHVSTLAATDEESVETATGWIAELQRQALRRADLILAETPTLAQRLRRDLGLPASAVQTVPAANTAAVAQALQGAQLRPAL